VRRWCLFGDQLGPAFLDVPDQPVLMIEAKQRAASRAFHRRKAHLVLSAMPVPSVVAVVGGFSPVSEGRADRVQSDGVTSLDEPDLVERSASDDFGPEVGQR
jgi:hypothetical protein